MPFSIKNNILAWLVFLVGSTLLAQQYPSRNITVEEGLPHNQVEALFKDSRGTLWVGTHNGLSKFENGELVNYYTEEGLSHNSVWAIAEDKNGHLWFGTYGGGVSYYDGRSFTAFTEENGLSNNYVRKLLVRDNYVFVGTNQGVNLIDLETHQVQTFPITDARWQAMGLVDYQGEIYCGFYDQGVYHLNTETLLMQPILERTSDESRLFSLYLDGDALYYGVSNFYKDQANGSILKYAFPEVLAGKKNGTSFGTSIVWNYAKDSQNQRYAAAWGVHMKNGGVYRVDENRFIDMTKAFRIDSRDIRTVYFDELINRLYVGTQDKGLYLVDLGSPLRYFDTARREVKDLFLHKGYRVVLLEDAVQVFEEGVFQWERPREDFFTYYLNHAETFRFSQGENTKSLEEMVFHRARIHEGSLWVATSFGVFKLHISGCFEDQFPIYPEWFAFDNQGRFLNPLPYEHLIVYDDINRLNSYTEDDYSRDHDVFLAPQPNYPVNITSLIKTQDAIYLGTAAKGLFVYRDKQLESLYESGVFTERELDKMGVSQAGDQLVVSTLTGTVYVLDLRNGMKPIRTLSRDEIQGNAIGFVGMYQNDVLVGTEEGLNLFGKNTYRLIDAEQGLFRSQISTAALEGDQLYLGTDQGYFLLNLETYLKESSPPLDLEVTAVRLDNLVLKSHREWFPEPLKELTVDYRKRNLSLEYEWVDHPYPKKLRYRYRLWGHDQGWSDYSTSPSVSFSYLPAGTYRLEVGIKDLYTGEHFTQSLFSVKVRPPFWQQPWLLTLAIFIIGALLVLLYQKRVEAMRKKERQKAAIQQRLVETKLEALSAQMNPHFTFNAMNSIQNYIIDNDVDNALLYLGEFAKLIRQTMEYASKSSISLAEEISYLKSYISLENMRMSQRVSVHWDYAGLNPQQLRIPPMILQPFVENVFLHAFPKDHPNPRLELRFRKEKEGLLCEIIDNGKGLQPDQAKRLYQPKGIALVKERIQLLNEKSHESVRVHSESGKGTTVQVFVQTK